MQKITRSLQRVLNLTASRSGAHATSKALNQKRHYRLVALHGHETAVAKQKEITLYIKVNWMCFYFPLLSFLKISFTRIYTINMIYYIDTASK